MLTNLIRIYRYRSLIGSLVVRELKARYRGSFLGYFWSFLNPLLQLAVYTIVFTTFMPMRSPLIEPKTYGLFLFCGILPWTWFSASLMESVEVLVAQSNLIRKLLFPVEVLPLVSVFSNMVHFLLGIPILVAAFVITNLAVGGPALTRYALLLPVVVLLQLVMTAGLALGLSALAVHFRDIKNILANFLMMLFFASAIIYPYADVPQKYVWLFRFNPLSHLMVAYQHILYFGIPLGARPFLATAASAVICFVVGYFLFDRLRDTLADEV